MVLTVPSPALLGQNIPVAVVVGIIGLAGMLFGRRSLAAIASFSLLLLLFLGKTVTDILKLGSPDTAVLVTMFTVVLALFEASSIVLTFTEDNSKLKAREDELSQGLKTRLDAWLRNQISNQARFAVVALGLSIGLLPIAGFTSVSTNQIAFSATLALMAVIVLLFLTVHRREPEIR